MGRLFLWAAFQILLSLSKARLMLVGPPLTCCILSLALIQVTLEVNSRYPGTMLCLLLVLQLSHFVIDYLALEGAVMHEYLVGQGHYIHQQDPQAVHDTSPIVPIWIKMDRVSIYLDKISHSPEDESYHEKYELAEHRSLLLLQTLQVKAV